MKRKVIIGSLFLPLISLSAVVTAQENNNPQIPQEGEGYNEIGYISPESLGSPSGNYATPTSNPNANYEASAPTSLPGEIPANISGMINILNTDGDRIREVNKEMYRKSQILNETPVAPPKGVNNIVVAGVSPGSTPPVIRLSKNRTTALVITDINGNPWPVVNYDGLNDDFTIKRLDSASPGGYIFSVTPRGGFVTGNLALVLNGLSSPITVEFVSDQKEVDLRSEIRVQAVGPNSHYTSVGMPDGIDTDLLSLLQGVAPSGAKELKVNSGMAQAWLGKDGRMYLRTRQRVMSPAFENESRSPDGTYAYKMMPVPVVLYRAGVGRYGEFVISGF